MDSFLRVNIDGEEKPIDQVNEDAYEKTDEPDEEVEIDGENDREADNDDPLRDDDADNSTFHETEEGPPTDTDTNSSLDDGARDDPNDETYVPEGRIHPNVTQRRVPTRSQSVNNRGFHLTDFAFFRRPNKHRGGKRTSRLGRMDGRHG